MNLCNFGMEMRLNLRKSGTGNRKPETGNRESETGDLGGGDWGGLEEGQKVKKCVKEKYFLGKCLKYQK